MTIAADGKTYLENHSTPKRRNFAKLPGMALGKDDFPVKKKTKKPSSRTFRTDKQKTRGIY